MESGKRKLDYESLTQKNDKDRRDQKRAKRERPISPDSQDADTEESESENDEVADFEKEDDAESKESNQTQFSTQRRICLVGSLLLCVFTIFAFAFILPCHHESCAKDRECGNKPLKHWSKNFSGMAPLVLRDFNDGKYSQENLLVGYRFPGNGGSRNTSCPGRHCQGVLSLKGCNGKSLWSTDIDGMLGKVQCIKHVRKKNHFQEGSGCFVQEGKDKVIFIDTVNGNKKWQAEKLGDVSSFRTIPDIDGDHFQDILLLHASPNPRLDRSRRAYTLGKNTLKVLSGRSGKLIGTSVLLSIFLQISKEHVFLRIHRVSATLHYILIGIKPESAKTGTLLAIEVRDLSNRVHNSSIAKRRTPWGSNEPNEFGFIELFKDTLVLTSPLLADLNKDGVEDVVLCSLDNGVTVQALDGKNAAEIWSRRLTVGVNDSALPAIVSLGNYLIDVAVMIKLNNHSSRIVVLNGKNGAVRWLFTLTNPLPVPPLGVPKADGIPEGLLLWLPKTKVNGYMTERYRKYHGNDETVAKKKKRDGPRRRRRDLSDVVHDLLEMMNEGKSRDEGEEHVIDDLQAIVDDEDDGNDDDDDGGDDNEESNGGGDVIDGNINKESNHRKDSKAIVHDKDTEDRSDVTDVKSLSDKDVYNTDNQENIKTSLVETHESALEDKPYGNNPVKIKPDNPTDHQPFSYDTKPDNPNDNRPYSYDTTPDNPNDNRPYSYDTKPDNPNDNRPYSYDTKPDNPNDNRPYSFYIKPDNPKRPYSYVIHPTPTKNSEQTRSIDYEALKKFLKKLKENLRSKQQPQATKPTTALPTPRTRFESFKESPHTKEKNKKRETLQNSAPLKNSSVEVKSTIEANKTKRGFFTGKERDKSLLLACAKQEKDLSKELSVVLVYRDEKRLRMMEITKDEIISLDPHEYKKQFGEPPPTANCQHFIPHVKSKPLVKDIDGDGRLDLIYVLEYRNTIIPDGYKKERFMKIKKLDIRDAILTRKSKRVNYSSYESKSSKRNERFDSPFAQWKTD
ncbi:uncharacterized protein LOC116306053 [Actinia tenebrosa]|uniref:Uncharacterized protein LOC116306053 n=1 Tax=Actinia tenebrosa TaxID=6105 RepID=A0A6P8J1C9_ACTTE|nr:uncharacterized protein LOC116306053 [Actinia tenebrosa]